MFQGPFDQVYRFYYERLNARQKQCYDRIVQNILEYRTQFELPFWIGERELSDVFGAVKDDYPLFFFVNSYGWKSRANTLYFTLTYRILEKNVQPLLDAVVGEVTPFIQSLRGKTEEEKELLIHDYLVKRVTYTKDRKYYVHQVLGPILYKKSVCEGFSRAAKMLFDMAGMRSAYVTGYGNCFGGIEKEKKDKSRSHAWNLVFIKNVPYYLDITFDAGLSNKEAIWYAYYNLSEEQIQRNHLLEQKLAECPQGGDYYTVRGLYIRRKSQLREVAARYLRAGKKVLIFRMDFSRPFGEVTRNVLDVVREVCRENPTEWRIKEYAAYEPQYIFYMKFQ